MALIAAQMYTLREFCKTPAEIAVACARVKKMGYDYNLGWFIRETIRRKHSPLITIQNGSK